MKKNIFVLAILNIFTFHYTCVAQFKVSRTIAQSAVNKTYSSVLKKAEYLEALRRLKKLALRRKPKTAVSLVKREKHPPVEIKQVQEGTREGGTLEIEEGWKFSKSELRAAYYMKGRGYHVILRKPQGRRERDGGTSDLLVNGVTCDVYTPITTNIDTIIHNVARKKDQARIVILDLSQTTVGLQQLGDVKMKLMERKIFSIDSVIILERKSLKGEEH